MHAVVASLVAAVGASAAVSVKMRSGFTDTSLFRENLLAVQVGGVLSAATAAGARPCVLFVVVVVVVHTVVSAAQTYI